MKIVRQIALFDAADLATDHDEVLALGARRLHPADDLGAAEGNEAYADPAGHPFCVGWGD